jgi:DNA-binding transcriptional ArsR family regulator
MMGRGPKSDGSGRRETKVSKAAFPAEGDDNTIEAIAGLGFAFAHPLRVRLLAALENGPGSAKSFSDEFRDVSLGDCSYHLRVLEKCGVIEEYDSRRARGATERIFRVVAEPDWVKLWPHVSSLALGSLRSARLRLFVEGIIAAASADISAPDDQEPVAKAGIHVVDQAGFEEISSVLQKALTAIELVEQKVQERREAGGSREQIEAMVAVSSFAISPPSAASRNGTEQPADGS